MIDPAERVFRALYQYAPDAECPVDQHRLAFLRRVLGAIDAAGLEVIPRVMTHFALEAWTKNVELLTDARAEIARYRAGLQKIVDADGWWDAPSLARDLLAGKDVT